MRWKTAVLSSAVLLACTGPISGAQSGSETQQATPPPTQAAPAAPAAAPAAAADANGALVLKEGTDVHLKFAQDLTSKTANDDDPVNMVLDEDIKVGDVTVCKAGAKALATVTHAKKAGMMGKGGELNIRLEYILVGDKRMRLRGTKGKEGEGKVGAAVALTVLFGPIGLIKHGKNVEVKQGTPLLAYVDQDTPVQAAK